jgi:PAS domain-containing protein
VPGDLSRGVVFSVIDITERKRAEEALRQNEFRFSRAELIAGLGNWEINLSTKRVTASNGARKIYGVGQQELTLDDIQNFPLPEYRSPLDDALLALIKNGAPYDIEFQIKRANDNQIIDIHSM